jgi:hypothetical protein
MKTSNDIVNQRVSRVSKAMLKGVPTLDIIETFTKSEGVNERQVYKYIEKAKELIKETARDKSDIEYHISKSLLRLDKLYFMNEKANNYPECRAVLDSTAKLLGFNAPTKTELTGKDGQPLNPTSKIISIEDFSEEEKLQLLSIARKVEK